MNSSWWEISLRYFFSRWWAVREKWFEESETEEEDLRKKQKTAKQKQSAEKWWMERCREDRVRAKCGEKGGWVRWEGVDVIDVWTHLDRFSICCHFQQDKLHQGMNHVKDKSFDHDSGMRATAGVCVCVWSSLYAYQPHRYYMDQCKHISPGGRKSVCMFSLWWLHQSPQWIPLIPKKLKRPERGLVLFRH